MKKILRRILLLFLLFVIGVTGTAFLLNNETTDDRSDMNLPTLPELMVEYDGNYANIMYGYREKMQVDFTRDSISPIDTTKQLTFVINPYEAKVNSLSYEIRTSDGSIVIENRKIKNLSEADGYQKAIVEISSDLLMNQEYSMEITLSTDKGDAYYYTRIVSRQNVNTGAYVNFVKNFYEKCMDKATADDLSSYIEPDENNTTTNFSSISINSTLRQISWGQLAPYLNRKGVPVIKDINETTASLVITYQIGAKDDSGYAQLYNVTEFYRLRYDEMRIRLLNFNRSANQIFNAESACISKEGLLLGIRNRNVNYMLNDDASVVAFEQEGDLYTYSPEDGKIVRIFTFRNGEDSDSRDNRGEHNIKIIRVDQKGNVDFVLYGYMNRGNHEGYSGVCVYHYNSDQNVIEERVFIPSTESYGFITYDLGTLSYVNSNNGLFLLFAQKLYLVDINEGSFKILDEGISNENFAVSDTNAHAAWLVENGDYAGYIKEIDFDTLETRMLSPQNDQQLRIYGFMNEDLVYGIVKNEDILTDDNGHLTEGAYLLRIEGFDGKTKKEYFQDGLYINKVTIGETLMEFELGQKEGNTYTFVKKDNIMNNKKKVANEVAIELISNATTGTQVRLAFEKNASTEIPLLIVAKQKSVDEHNIALDTQVPKENGFYVYAAGKLNAIFTNPAEAIKSADSLMGVVLNRNQQYVWERGNKKTQYQMNAEDIPAPMLNASLDQKALQEAFGDSGTVLDLSGCTLDNVLYEVSAQRPVIAKTGPNSSVIITGYDEYNTYLYDPATGQIAPYGMQDSTALFEKAGNIFITYMENINH